MEADAIDEAAKLTGRTSDVVQQAAAFFVEQILLAPGSNSYRVLGATPQASSSDLRRNMAYLVRWLHPDTKLNSDRTTFVNRVTFAWDDLKTAERRAAYDSTLRDPKKPANVGTKRSKKPMPRPQLSNAAAMDGAAQPANLGLFQRALQLLFKRRRT
jgi:DnaJ-class molecular chaperone